MGIPEDVCSPTVKHRNFSPARMPWLLWLQQILDLGQGLPGQVPRDPPQYSQRSQAKPRGMVVFLVPLRAQALSPAVCPQRPKYGLHGLGAAEVATESGKGWPWRSGQAAGLGRCPRGSSCPYLPSSVEDSLGAVAVSPMAAQKQV